MARTTRIFRNLGAVFPLCVLSALFLSWGIVTEHPLRIAGVFYAISVLSFLSALAAMGEE